MRDEELGDLLEATLRSYADEAPQAHHGELAATAATVLVAVAIGGTWSAIGPGPSATTADSAAGEAAGGTRDQNGPASKPSSELSPEFRSGGWRSVTYRDVQVSVPVDWVTGVTGWPWCVPQPDPSATSTALPGEDETTPGGWLGLPGKVPDIVCTPAAAPVTQLGQHVWLSPTTEKSGRRTVQLGGGWIRDTVVLNGVSVEVQTRSDPGLRRDLLAAIRIL